MPERRVRGLGLLPKLMMAILIPILISFGVIATIYFSHMTEMVSTTMAEMKSLNASVVAQMETMSSVATAEGVQRLNQLGERMIREKARDVAH